MNRKLKIGIIVLVVLVLLMLIFRDQIEVFLYELTTPIGPGGMVPDPVNDMN